MAPHAPLHTGEFTVVRLPLQCYWGFGSMRVKTSVPSDLVEVWPALYDCSNMYSLHCKHLLSCRMGCVASCLQCTQAATSTAVCTLFLLITSRYMFALSDPLVCCLDILCPAGSRSCVALAAAAVAAVCRSELTGSCKAAVRHTVHVSIAQQLLRHSLKGLSQHVGSCASKLFAVSCKDAYCKVLCKQCCCCAFALHTDQAFSTLHTCVNNLLPDKHIPLYVLSAQGRPPPSCQRRQPARRRQRRRSEAAAGRCGWRRC
jgi:hypothetical protein